MSNTDKIDKIDQLNKEVMGVIKTYDVKRKTFINDVHNEKYINKTIDKIYVINLQKDQIRRNYMIRLFEKYGINFEIIIVPLITEEQYKAVNNLDMTIGEVGCYVSHLFCMYDAIQNEYSKIIIFEDDIIIHKDFHALFENVMKHQTEDIVILGVSDFDFYKDNSRFYGNVYTTDINNQIYGSYGICYSKRGYNNIFQNRLIKPNIIDNKLLHLYKTSNTTYCICFPNLLTTDWTTTNLNHSFGVNDQCLHNIYLKRCYKNNFDYTQYNTLFLFILKNECIDKFKSFRDNIDKCLENCLPSNYDFIKDKIAYDYFTTDDIVFMLNIS